MEKRKAIDLYCDQMIEIKKRLGILDFFFDASFLPFDPQQSMEIMCLQIRKILELIANSSLVANKHEYDLAVERTTKYTGARILLQQLERVNPDFYPRPAILQPADEHGNRSLVDVKEDVLTKKDFESIYEKCHKMLHSRSPFKSGASLHFYQNNIVAWRNMIVHLLSSHQVRLAGQTEFWLVILNKQGQEVQYSTWIPRDEKKGKLRADALYPCST
jgi:hypothetical protein